MATTATTLYSRFVFTLLSGASLLFSADIQGRVLDPQRAPIARAAVTLYSRGGVETRKAITGNSGEFLFPNTTGSYLMEASAGGFSSSGLIAVDAVNASNAEIVLDLAVVNQRIAITAAGMPQSLDATAKALDIYSAEEIERRGEFSLTEVLRQAPGMRVQQLGGPGSFARLHTRGLRAFDTAVLIDGFRLRDAAAPQGDATGFLNDVLIVNPARVEVLRGSGSSLYGTHAMAGVVQVITDQGGGVPHGELSVDGGGLGMFRGTARVSGGAWRDRVQYSGGLTHLNVTRGLDDDDRARNTSVQGYAQLRLAPRTRLNGRLFFSDVFLGLNSSSFAAPGGFPAKGLIPAIPLAPDQVALAEAGKPFAWGSATFAPALNDPDARRLSRQTASMVGLTHELRPDTVLRVSYQDLSTSRDNRDGPAGARFPPRFNNASAFDGRIDNVQARFDTSIGKHQWVTAGYEFERERFENLATDQNPNSAQRLFARTAVTERSHSFFAQDQIRLFDSRLLISFSGRWQGFRLTLPAFEGGAPRYTGGQILTPPDAFTGDSAVAYLFRATGTKLRTHIGNSYRAPALYERFGTFFFGGAFSPLGDPRLSPERSIAADGGIDQYLAGSRVRLSATYFYTRLQNVIAFGGLLGQDPFGRFSGYLNTRGGLARGVELSGEAGLTRSTRVLASYTYTRAQEVTPVFADGLLLSPRIPRRMGSWMITQAIGKHLDVTVDMYAAGEAVSPFFAGTGTRAFVFSGAKKADLAASYTVTLTDRTRIQLFTRIDNFLNQTWYEDGFRVPKAWAVFGLRALF